MKPSAPAQIDPPTADPGTRPRVLIADDSRVMRLAVLKILGTDFDVVQAENGAIAWEQISEDRNIQAVLTDIQMPQMDGYELMCRIRASEDGHIRDLPVMAITGSDDDTIKQQALACGATDFIIKPLDALQLRARVQAYVQYDQQTRVLEDRALSLEDQAITDPQTGLRSRRYLMQRGEQDLAHAQRRGQDLALLRIEIDNFKKIYRAHGDDAVDQLMVWLAKLLFSSARTEDTVSRVSGAEFAILATNTDLNGAKPLCERVLAAVSAQPFVHGAASIPITLSIGLASLGADRCSTIEAMYQLAHRRLCDARLAGGNRVCVAVTGEVVAQVEEVELAPLEDLPGFEPLPAVEAMSAEPAAVEPCPVETLPVETASASTELEFVDVELPENIDLAVESPSAASSEPLAADLMSIDKALVLLAQGKGRMLLPYLESMLREIQPLLDFHRTVQKSKS